MNAANYAIPVQMQPFPYADTRAPEMPRHTAVLSICCSQEPLGKHSIPPNQASFPRSKAPIASAETSVLCLARFFSTFSINASPAL